MPIIHLSYPIIIMMSSELMVSITRSLEENVDFVISPPQIYLIVMIGYLQSLLHM